VEFFTPQAGALSLWVNIYTTWLFQASYCFYFVVNYYYYMMIYSSRYQELSRLFATAGDKGIDLSDVHVRYLLFSSQCSDNEVLSCDSSMLSADMIPENQQFYYPVFYPAGNKVHKETILLLHGLNERNWNKYLPWAEYLCRTTGKVVILFPIAYHVNRSPLSWSNPRELAPLLEERKALVGNDRSLSFANLALSQRLSERPLRFFTSGRQSYNDVVSLCTSIVEGRNPLLKSGSKIDVFAYSIGAFLAQILFLSNPSQLFSDSRLFVFCGGGIFSSMYGCSRSIMDAASYERLYQFYMKEFRLEDAEQTCNSELAQSFLSMIAPANLKEKRLRLFDTMKGRLQGISLVRDTVMPFSGVKEAMGDKIAHQTYSLMDFSFDYTHENPFPIGKDTHEEVDSAFLKIFKMASGFLTS
jgi:hypothetical protein